MQKRLFALILCWTMVLSLPARAELSQTAGALLGVYEAGEPVQMDVSEVQFDVLSASDDAKRVTNEALAPLALSMTLKGGEQALALRMGESELTSIAGTLVDGGTQSPLDALKAIFTDALPIFYDTLAQGGKTSEVVKSLSIKNVGYSKKQIIYTYTKDEANALTATLHEIFDQYAAPLLGDVPYKEAFLTYLEKLTFADKLVVKRFESKDGADMGLQITTKITADGADKRSLTLFGGYAAGAGAYVSFACPAVKGNNNFKSVLTYLEKQTTKQATLDLTVDTTRRVDSDRYTLALDVALKNKLTDGEAISGTITHAETVNGVKTTWTVKPTFAPENDALSGAVTLEKVQDKATLLKFSAKVRLLKGTLDAFQTAQTTVSVTGLTQAEQTQAFLPFSAKLAYALNEKIKALPEKDRALLLNLLSTDAWMNGPTVPVQAQEGTSSQAQSEWTVTEGENKE